MHIIFHKYKATGVNVVRFAARSVSLLLKIKVSNNYLTLLTFLGKYLIADSSQIERATQVHDRQSDQIQTDQASFGQIK